MLWMDHVVAAALWFVIEAEWNCIIGNQMYYVVARSYLDSRRDQLTRYQTNCVCPRRSLPPSFPCDVLSSLFSPSCIY